MARAALKIAYDIFVVCALSRQPISSKWNYRQRQPGSPPLAHGSGELWDSAPQAFACGTPSRHPGLARETPDVRALDLQPGQNLCAASTKRLWELIAMQSTLNISRPSGDIMASITIRNLEDDLKRRLRIRAAEHGRSMEEEAREILRHVVSEPATPRNLAASIRARMAPLGGVELDLPAREAMREPPRLGGKRA
jgi:plasmid stability protein